jgi:hypothetical protein
MKLLLTIYIAGVLYNLCYSIKFFKERDEIFTNKDKINMFKYCFLSWFVFLNKLNK